MIPKGRPARRTAPPMAAAMMEPVFTLDPSFRAVAVAEALLLVAVNTASREVPNATTPLSRERGRLMGVC